MFDELRKGSKLFTYFVAVAFVGLIFIVWGADFQLWSGNGSNTPRNVANEAGRVNGEPISRNEYSTMVNRTLQGMAAQTGQPVDDQTRVMIQNQAWQSLVQQALLSKEARERGLSATDPEVVFAVMNDPLPQFVQSPQFQRDGQFDISLYHAMLQDPANDTRGLEAQYAMNLPLEKLQKRVMATAIVSDAELWNQYRMQNEKAKVSYLMVPSGNFQVNESGIDEAALQSYYDAHKDDFRTQREAVIRWVSVPKVPSADDSLAAYDLAASLLEDHKSGQDFLELMDYSEGPANQRGGENAAWISPNTLPTQVRAVVQALPVGEVSDVIVEPRGFHVVRVEEMQEDETKGKQIKIADLFIPLQLSSDTYQAVAQTAIAIRQAAGDGLGAAAADHGLKAMESQPFGQTGFIPGLGNAPELQQFAFQNQPGTISAPMERPNDWVVVEVVERREPHVPALSEITDRVRRETAESMRREKAVAHAQKLLTRVQGGESMEDIAASDSLATFDTTDEITRLAFSRGIGNDPDLIGPIFAAANTGLIPEVLAGRRGGFILRVDEKIPADRAAFDTQKAQLRESVTQARQGEALGNWLADLTESSTVRDFRTGLF